MGVWRQRGVMPKEIYKTQSVAKIEILWFFLGLMLLIAAIALIGFCATKSEFLGLEKYYDQYSYIIYIIGVIFGVLAQFFFSKMSVPKGSSRPDSDCIIR